jgi:hypothetical protein
MTTANSQRIQIKPSNKTESSPLSSFTSYQTVSIEASTPNVFNSAYYPSPTESVFNPATDEFPFRPVCEVEVDTLTKPVISTEHANRRIRNASSARRYVHFFYLTYRSRARKRNELEDLKRENSNSLI